MPDKIAQFGQTHRAVTDHFGADMDSPVSEIDERMVSKVIVMVVPVDYPAIEIWRRICGIMKKKEAHTVVIECQRSHRFRTFGIMISLNEGDLPVKMGSILCFRQRIPALSQVSEIANLVIW